MKNHYFLGLACLLMPVLANASDSNFERLLSPAQRGETTAATEADVIWTPPCVEAGHSYTYKFEAGCTGMSRVGLTDVLYNTSNGIKTEMIADTQGDDYYMKNPLPRTAIGSYIAGKLVEGDEDIYIECQLPQWLNARESTNSGVRVGIGKETKSPDGMLWYEPVTDPAVNVIRYVMNEDEDFELTVPEGYALIAVYNYLDEEWEKGVFAGAAVTHVIYKDAGRKQTQTIPADLEAEEWGMLYSNDQRAHKVTVAIDEDNNKFYVAGFHPEYPESAVVGDIAGDKITFAANQYIGEDAASYFYLTFSKAEFLSTSDRGDVYDFKGGLLPSVEADYDADARTVSCAMEEAWFCNAGTDQLYYAGFYVGPMYMPDKGGTPTPQDPEILEVMDYMPEFGYGGFLFDMPMVGTEGEVLDPSHYTYIVYFDGEPYTFSPEEYPGVTVPMTEIPFDFEDGEAEDFRVEGTTHIVCWRTDGFESLGVQTLYTSGDVVNRSNVVTHELSGLESVTVATPQSVEYYNLTGMKVAEPANGVYIKRVTFDNGKTLTSKVVVR